MSLEAWLLLLESALLAASLVLLVYGIREGRAREHLIREVDRAQRVLSRQEYFFSIIDSMLDAKQEIIGCITGRPPSGEEDKKMTAHLVEIIEKMTGAGVRIKYLFPKFPDRLQVALLYTRAGAEVLFSGCLLVHDLRFMVVDEKSVVIGLPQSVGDEEATKKGYRIPSVGLALILKDYFKSCEKQSSLRDYLREVMEHSGATVEHLAREYKIEEKVLRKLADPAVAAGGGGERI